MPTAEWTKVVDQGSGHPYWWCAATGDVSWTAPAAEAAGAAAASPWVSVVDETSGSTYWWNQDTDERQWTSPHEASADGAPVVQVAAPPPPEPPPPEPSPPSAAEAPAAAPGSLPPLLMQRLAQRGVVSSDGAGGAGARPGGVAAAAPPDSAAVQERLPPGWSRDRDPAGNVFYCHASSGQTSWTLPGAAPSRPTAGGLAAHHGMPGPQAGPSLGPNPQQQLQPAAAQEGGAARLSSADITAMVEARLAAKQSKDYAAADRLREELSRAGVTVDDRLKSWSAADGRSGILPGGRTGPTVPAAMAAAVDTSGRVSAAAAAAAANAAAAGWGSGGGGGGGAKRRLPPQQQPGGLVGSGRAAKEARYRARTAQDPLLGYELQAGGGGGGGRGGSSGPEPGSHKGLPSPGEILRRNAGNA